VEKCNSNGIFQISLSVFNFPRMDFHKVKHVASNKPGINVVVMAGCTSFMLFIHTDVSTAAVCVQTVGCARYSVCSDCRLCKVQCMFRLSAVQGTVYVQTVGCARYSVCS